MNCIEGKQLIEINLIHLKITNKSVGHITKPLKYLSIKDYTEQQMRKKLMDSGDYDDAQLDTTIQLFIRKKFN